MKFAPVLPPELYYKFDGGDYHMVQAHLLAKNRKLQDWTQQALSRGHTVILDNGVIELGTPATRALYDVAKKVRPTLVVCPDAYMDPDKTLAYQTQHLLTLQHLCDNVMLVPQGRTLGKWMDCALEMLKQSLPTLVYVGVPKYLDVYHELGRLLVVNALVNDFKIGPSYIHLLGIHSIQAVAAIVEKFPDVLGVDSTLPVAAALYRTGQGMDTVDKVTLDREDWYLTAWDLSHAQIASLQENIGWTRQLVANAPSGDRSKCLGMGRPMSTPGPSL